VCFELFRDIDRMRRNARKLGPLTVNLHPDVADYLLTEEADNLQQLQEQLRQKLTVRAVPDFHHEQFEIFEY
jgi:Ribonuclease G/E